MHVQCASGVVRCFALQGQRAGRIKVIQKAGQAVVAALHGVLGVVWQIGSWKARLAPMLRSRLARAIFTRGVVSDGQMPLRLREKRAWHRNPTSQSSYYLMNTNRGNTIFVWLMLLSGSTLSMRRPRGSPISQRG